MSVGTITKVDALFSLKPNAQIDWRLHELGFIGYMTALVPIKAGEEILVDYGIGIPEGWKN